MKKQFYLILVLFLSLTSFSQKLINITVKDTKTKEVLRFCNLVIEGTTKGYITNGDGKAQIRVFPKKDILVISYIGYHTLSIPADQLFATHEILLVKKSFSINEVTVVSDDGYLYDIMQKCRQSINRNHKESIAKTYYAVETEAKGKPIEFLECYYNGHLKGIAVDELIYKNGRSGISTMDSNYFHTFNTSKAIGQINITEKNDLYPRIPLQFSKSKMKKHFTLQMLGMNEEYYHLNFKPKNNDNESFEGEIWIERNSNHILKIDLKIKETNIHPFYPLHDCDNISAVSFNITNTYNSDKNLNILDHTNFEYNFIYHSVRDSTVGDHFAKNNRILDRTISTKGIVLFYDYDTPFIIPYFEDLELYHRSDYSKMKFIPFNKFFWRANNPLDLTQEQQVKMSFFSEKGELVNFMQCDYGRAYLGIRKGVNDSIRFWWGHFREWSSQSRIHLLRNEDNTKVYSPEVINQSIKTNLYKLKVQILLDVTRANDTLYCSSYTFFDPYQTRYHLPSQAYTRAFFNIYFDICEIERRKMQAKLDSRLHSKEEIDEIYQNTLNAIDSIGKKYFKEVNLGENEFSLIQWNRYIFEHLKIDNLKMIRETDKDDVNAKALEAL